MKKGGHINSRVAQTARTIGLIAPIALFLYGWLIPAGHVNNLHFQGVPLFLTLMGAWIGVALWRFLWPTRTYKQHLTILILHHAFASIYVLFIAGFSAAFISGWALLCLVSYLYFGFYGFTISAVMLVLLTGIDLGYYEYEFSEALGNFINVLMTLLTASAAVAIAMVRVDERRAIERSRKRERIEHERIVTIINNLADAVFVTDKSGVISIYNAAGLGLLDTNASIDGKHLDEVFTLEDADGSSVNLFQRIKEAKAVTTDDSMRRKTGDDVMRLEFTYAPIRSSFTTEGPSTQLEGFIIIARDVTRLKSLEEERDEFISVVSHELRTPVTVTEGTISNVQLMFDRGERDTEKIKDILEGAHDQVVYLAKMINDLSTLSRAERGVASEVELIDVAEMAHDLYNEYSPEATKQGLHLNLDVAPKIGHVSTSRLYLHELLQNFITNAIKYTHEGSVTMKVSRSKDIIHFSVSDTGIGISKSDQTKIFNKFYRSEDYRTRETGGTGLGLYVAMKLSKKLGTHIDLKSRLNHGSTFSFELPAHTDDK